MITDRKAAFDTISRVLAVTRLDIEHHQAINDLSLNIHGEYFFRDVFNFVYSANFVNANQDSLNEPYIDLVDRKSKKVVQITTTRTKEKIKHSLNALNKAYKGYNISIFYLLEKAKPNKQTIEEIQNKYSFDISNSLKDSSDLIRDIGDLEENKLIELSERYFSGKEEKYTDQIVLDLVFKKLIKEHGKVRPSFDDDLGSIESTEKITLNNINQRISNHINESLDYTCIIENIDNGELVSNLRDLVINDMYKKILTNKLKSIVNKSDLSNMPIDEMNLVAKNSSVDFNNVLSSLKDSLESLITVTDFNSMKISWVIVSYFFEICDVGSKE